MCFCYSHLGIDRIRTYVGFPTALQAAAFDRSATIPSLFLSPFSFPFFFSLFLFPFLFRLSSSAFPFSPSCLSSLWPLGVVALPVFLPLGLLGFGPSCFAPFCCAASCFPLFSLFFFCPLPFSPWPSGICCGPSCLSRPFCARLLFSPPFGPFWFLLLLGASWFVGLPVFLALFVPFPSFPSFLFRWLFRLLIPFPVLPPPPLKGLGLWGLLLPPLGARGPFWAFWVGPVAFSPFCFAASGLWALFLFFSFPLPLTLFPFSPPFGLLCFALGFGSRPFLPLFPPLPAWAFGLGSLPLGFSFWV